MKQRFICIKDVNSWHAMFHSAVKGKIYGVDSEGYIVNGQGLKICGVDSVNGETCFKPYNGFSKSELKTGMAVRLGNIDNDVYLVINNQLVSTSGWMPLDRYQDDLNHIDDYKLNITEVLTHKYNFENNLGWGLSRLNDFPWATIWKRTEKSEEEISREQKIAELKQTIEMAKAQIEDLEEFNETY